MFINASKSAIIKLCHFWQVIRVLDREKAQKGRIVSKTEVDEKSTVEQQDQLEPSLQQIVGNMSILATQNHSQSHFSNGGGGEPNSFTHNVSVADPSFLLKSEDEWTASNNVDLSMPTQPGPANDIDPNNDVKPNREEQKNAALVNAVEEAWVGTPVYNWQAAIIK